MDSRKLPHDSAMSHVSGESVFINDIEVADLLYGHVVYSPHAHASIISFDLTMAKALQGVFAVICYKDIPGHNQMGPVVHDEACLAAGMVSCAGQAMFLIAADDEETARKAEKLIVTDYKVLEPIVDIETAMSRGELTAPARLITRGNPDLRIKNAPHNITGKLLTGPQEHWYLETQAALCVPGEGNEMKVFASSQNPSETQTIVAGVLGVNKNEVVCEVRRLGGAFGGKETQGSHVAAWTALLAKATGRPVRIHLSRNDDQKITGKRHRFLSYYEIGFDIHGKILAYTVDYNADAGHATDLSMAILERAMLHAENAYFIPDIRITGRAWKTNLPSNTAFRGFGGPQGMAVIENAIDRIARFLNKDTAEIRKINFYGQECDNITPYGQVIDNNRLPLIFENILVSADYYTRRQIINEFNNKHDFKKRGLALTPVKFGISFTTSFLNQAGALVMVYTDGTVLVNHGGTEMGQGLNTKIRAIAAQEFGIQPDQVKINATDTSKVPNTSPTAASSGSDLNGMAVKNAIDEIKNRLSAFVATELQKRHSYSCGPENLVFNNGKIFDPSEPLMCLSFEDAVRLAHINQLSLSSTGFYKTPDIHFDRESGTGAPFHYFSYGMAVSEVEVDLLTGGHRLLRTDIIQDVGESINTGIDQGQIEGAFIQGLGWVTTEEIRWDKDGKIMQYSPDTYKIPTAGDIPVDFRIELLNNVPNFYTIRKSKAIGEPPFMLALSVWLAIKDAISAAAGHKKEPELGIPATHEAILLASEKIAPSVFLL